MLNREQLEAMNKCSEFTCQGCSCESVGSCSSEVAQTALVLLDENERLKAELKQVEKRLNDMLYPSFN